MSWKRERTLLSEALHGVPDSTDEHPTDDHRTARAPWRILVVDDDAEVHAATRYALRDATLLQRPVELLHARDAESARGVMGRVDDIAVAIVDAVMETPHAGLELVRWFREQGYQDLRVILRTGQPGRVPEQAVTERYDINDYRTKDELTRSRLLCVLTSAVRAYAQLNQLTQNRSGLEMVVENSARLLMRRGITGFSYGLLTQLCALLGVPNSGVVCATARHTAEPARAEEFTVLTASGRFAGLHGKCLADTGERLLLDALREHVGTEEVAPRDDALCLRFRSREDRELFVYVSVFERRVPSDLALLKVFAGNIAVGFENVDLVERLDQLAYEDRVLGVPNDNALLRLLDERMAHPAEPASVALVRVEQYESLLGTLGVTRTAEHLRGLYELLAEAVPQSLLIARESEPCFALLLPGNEVDDHLARSLCGPWQLGSEFQPTLTATVALVEHTRRMADAATVLRAARATLVEARTRRAHRVTRHDHDLLHRLHQRVELEARLRSRIESGQGLEVHLQPLVDTHEGRIVGAEALSRWTEDGRPIAPSQFIPIAESCGLTRALTQNALSRVGRWRRRRIAAGRDPIPVAVNISVRDLDRPDFASSVLEQLEREELLPGSIHFEVTESLMMHELATNVAQLRLLADAGYRVAVDDFGTGYSSLAYLDELPIHIIKLDRTFIARLDGRRGRGSIAATVQATAAAMDLQVVAEGVEHLAQHHALVGLGYRFCQGFLYGRPVAIDDFDERFEHWSLGAALDAAEGHG